MKNIIIPKCLRNMESFSRNEFSKAMFDEYGLTEQQSKYELQKELDNGEVLRKGWNQYTIPTNKQVYLHNYSGDANAVVGLIEKKYYDVDFQVFEMTQLNQFMNHLVAHNTIFVAVENELVDYVFDTKEVNEALDGISIQEPEVIEYLKEMIESNISEE